MVSALTIIPAGSKDASITSDKTSVAIFFIFFIFVSPFHRGGICRSFYYKKLAMSIIFHRTHLKTDSDKNHLLLIKMLPKRKCVSATENLLFRLFGFSDLIQLLV